MNQATSTFDPDTFMQTSFTEANDTKYSPVPEGEYQALIKETKVRATDKGSVILDVVWVVDDEGVKMETGLPEPTVRQSVFLDMSASGGLDGGKGKNIQLGKLREAVGQNTSGSPWNFNMLAGSVARIRVKHRIVEDATYADVKGVTKV